jgi:hypothetical protein
VRTEGPASESRRTATAWKKWWNDPGDAAGGTASKTAQPAVAPAGLVGELLWDMFLVKR